MLNPVKTNHEMLMELAGMPHMAGGKRVYDVLDQYQNNIAHAIRQYTKLTGSPPTPAEIKALEDHLRGTANPTPQRAQTLARTAAQEPNANMLVDEFGRAYAPMVDPRTGQLTTPERAKGFSVSNQFEVNPQTRKAREKLYATKPDVIARPDEFVQMANVGRASNRTNLRSTTPSTEELLAMQHNAENVADDVGGLAKAPNETYGLTEGPTSASQVFADTSSAIEHGALAESKAPDLREQLVMALNPQAGERVPRPLKAEIERARQSFLARGIEPDQEDIINAVLSDRNAAQHNYLGINPTGERPFNDPKAGKSSPEFLAWQEQMRAAGQPEAVWGRNPADWDAVHKRNYLLDTLPENRQPFAADWRLEDLVDKREKVVHKQAGGVMKSPRDMQAEMLFRNPEFARQYFANARAGMEPVEKAYIEGGEAIEPQATEYKPSPSERLAATGQEFLEKAGVRRPIARRASQTAFGGQSSAIPGGFGALDIASMVNPSAALAYGPVSAANIGHYIGKGEPVSAGMESLNLLPFGGMVKRAFTGR